MTTLFSGGAENLANDMNVPLLGKIPLDPLIGKACDFLSWKLNSFDLGSDVPELVPSVSDLNVDSAYFADLTNILWDLQKNSSPLC